MRQDVEKYVSQCDGWLRRKRKSEYTAPLGEVRQPTYTFEITSVDICGPYSVTPRGNRYILPFLDHFTKFAEAILISDMTAEICTQAYATT
jgi:hypothetical protein